MAQGRGAWREEGLVAKYPPEGLRHGCKDEKEKFTIVAVSRSNMSKINTVGSS